MRTFFLHKLDSDFFEEEIRVMNITFSITGRHLTPNMTLRGSLKLSYFDVGEFAES